MFSGIISNYYPVVAVIRQDGLHQIIVALPSEMREGLELGASVSIDGVCLTVTAIESEHVSFDIMGQTLHITTLAKLQPGDHVNVERSLTSNAEIGGHEVSGHVDGIAHVVAVDTPPNNLLLTFRVEPAMMRYIFTKGFVAMNGVSLTVASVDRTNHTFTVWLIPETIRRTTFAQKRVGDAINIEVHRMTQVLVDTVREFLHDIANKKALGEADISAVVQKMLGQPPT